MPISYSEYNSLVDILKESGDQTYDELMKKEKEVLSTVNNVVNHIKEKDARSSQFINTSISEIVMNLFMIWPAILADLSKSKTGQEILDSLIKDDRAVYIGISFILGAFMIFLTESS